MPKNHTIHQQTDEAPGAIRTLPPTRLFTHTTPSSHPPGRAQVYNSTNAPTGSPPNAQHQGNARGTPQRNAKGTAQETTLEEPETPNAKSTAKSHHTASSRATQRRAAYKKHTGIYCLNGFYLPCVSILYYILLCFICQFLVHERHI